VHELSAHACSSIRAFDWGAWSSPVEAAMNDTIPHDTSGGAASANPVRGRSAQWDRVGHITLSDRCRRPVGREKKKKSRCLIFGTRTIATQSLREMASAWFGGSCAQQSRGSTNIVYFRLHESRVTPVIGQFIPTVSGLVLWINFGTDSGIVPEAVQGCKISTKSSLMVSFLHNYW